MKINENVVASCIRIEQEKGTGELFLVFKVVNSDFKRRVKQDWTQDIELKILGKDLIYEKS